MQNQPFLSEPTVGGVPAGGYRDVYEVRILVCYLLSCLSKPLAQEHIFSVLEEHHLTDYFTFATAVSQLIEARQLSSMQQEQKQLLILEPLGQETATMLQYSLPRAVRERVVRSGLLLLSHLKQQQENKVEILPHQNGYYVTLTMQSDRETNLLSLCLFVPDLLQAKQIEEQFLADPTVFYQKVISYLVE